MPKNDTRAQRCQDPITWSRRQWLRRSAGWGLGCTLMGVAGEEARAGRAAAATPAPAAQPLSGGTVVVLTSYPQALASRYQAAFEAAHPGARMEILWRHSADALAYLRRSQGEVDVYWAPAPGNFAALAAEGRFGSLPAAARRLPVKVGGQPIADAQGHYAAFELAGYGIAYNTEAVQRLGRPASRDWQDLMHPAYAGQIQIPHPGRVGFAPVLIEALLQGQGWEGGWALLQALGALSDLGSASDARPDADDLVTGRRAARLTIDFFAASAIDAGAPVRFAYPPRTAYNPAQIAVLADAPHPALAQAYVDFAVSGAGQSLLLDPDVHRLPVRPALYREHPELPARPFAPGQMAYDGALTRARQGLVAQLFELALVQRHADQATLWDRLFVARQSHGAKAQATALAQVQALLCAPPIDVWAQAEAMPRYLFAEGLVALPSEAQAALLSRWVAERDQRLQAAGQTLDAVEQALSARRSTGQTTTYQATAAHGAGEVRA